MNFGNQDLNTKHNGEEEKKEQIEYPFRHIRVGEKYQLGKKIGSGAFGEIYMGIKCFI